MSWQVKALVEATPISIPASVGATTALAGHRRGRHVDDGQDVLPAALRVAQRGQGIGGLAGLRDEEGEPSRLHRRLAVAELGGNVDLDRQARQALEPILAISPAR